MFTVTFADGRRISVSAVDDAGARRAAYRIERSLPIASVTPVRAAA